MVNNIPVNGWPQLKDLEAVQPTLDRLDKIEAWKRTVKEETFTGDDITIENALALPARSLITEIEPIQDLHGYDKPWVGGAGKNKCNIADAEIGTAWNGASNADRARLVIPCKANTQYTISINGTNSLDSVYVNDSATVPAAGSGDVFTTSKTFTTGASSAYIIVGFSKTNIAQADVDALLLQLELGGTATSYTPYSNICPISGRDSVAVERTSANYVTEYLNGGNVIADGSIVSNEQYSLALMPVKQGETYTASHNTESYWVWAFYRSKPTIGSGSYNNDRMLDVISASKTFTAPIDGYIAIRVPVTYRELMVNGGSTALPYEPSYATGFTIQLGQTVYDGDADWNMGDGSSRTGKYTLNGTEGVNWSLINTDPTRQVIYANIQGVLTNPKTTGRKQAGGKFSAFYYAENYAVGVAFIDANNGVWLNMTFEPNKFTDSNDFKTWLATNNIEFTYELATPLTLTLTPTEVQMLKGYNRVTLSDGYGTIELKALTGANWS